jgi:tRNA pseudouridine38-40 synthase
VDEVNIRLVIEYDGKNYFGWQRQKKRPSVQQTIEDALSIIFPNEKINLIGSGRTDTGVHALNQVANFKIRNESFKRGKSDKLVYSLNSILPGDIAVKEARLAPPDFHSRYSAKKRVYKYYFTDKKRAINNDKLYFFKTKFDIDLAKDYCKLVEGVHSFRYLCKNKTDRRDFMSQVYYAKINKQKGGVYLFEICANRFLHSMVRAIAGLMLKVASSKLSTKEFKHKFENKEPLKIQFLPANALFLDRVIY